MERTPPLIMFLDRWIPALPSYCIDQAIRSRANHYYSAQAQVKWRGQCVKRITSAFPINVKNKNMNLYPNVWYVNGLFHQLFLRKWSRKLTLSSITAFYELILVDLDFPPNISFALGGAICLLLGVGNAISIQVSRSLLEQRGIGIERNTSVSGLCWWC
jgi:hypothetical protein